MISASWNTSLPMSSEFTCPVMHTRGMLSAKAVAIPVITLVAPGPEVTAQTPTFPETLANPLAAWAAFCSVRISTVRMGDSRILL